MLHRFTVSGIKGTFCDTTNVLSLDKFRVVVKRFIAKRFIPMIWHDFHAARFSAELNQSSATLWFSPDVGMGFRLEVGPRAEKVVWEPTHDWVKN